MKQVLFLVGASGVGKTTIARILEQRAPWTGRTHYFDTIGSPSAEVMEAEFGGTEEWQRSAARQWIDRLAAAESGPQLIEGQVRPSFGCDHGYGIANWSRSRRSHESAVPVTAPYEAPNASQRSIEPVGPSIG